MAWLAVLLKAIGELFGFLRERRLIEAGRQEQAAADQDAVEQNVEAAERAIAEPDPERDERLRRRFDRARQSTEKD